MPASSHMVGSEFLVGLTRQYELISRDAQNLVAGLTETQFNKRLGPRRWSVGECLQHLTLTADLFVPVIDEAIRTAPSGGNSDFRLNLLERAFLWAVEPPVAIKTRTNEAATPSVAATMEDCVDAYFARQKALVERMERSEGLPLREIKIASPFVRRLRYSLGFAYAFLAAHERRHLWQSWQVRKAGPS